MEQNLDGAEYLDFLEHTLPDLLDDVLTPEQQGNMIFMQDGAPPHFAQEVRDFLNEVLTT